MTLDPERLSQLTAMSYDDYLLTPEWQEKREQALARALNRCQICYGSEQLNVHHRTYEHGRGAEWESDLTVLCSACHIHFHHCLPPSGTTYDWLGGYWEDTPLQAKTFETFRVELQPEAYHTVKAFQDILMGTLVLHGTCGTGKTHLLAALCNETESFYCSALSLFNAIQYRMQHGEEYHTIIAQAIQTPLLVIDNIDRVRYSEFREEIYFDIIDGRVTRELPIAISTNRPEMLAVLVGEAVCSRLKIGQIAIEMVGEDYRKEL